MQIGGFYSPARWIRVFLLVFFGVLRPGFAYVPEAVARYEKGIALAEREHRYRQAIPELEAALKLDPTIVEAVISIGDCYASVGEFAKARSRYEAALKRRLSRDLALHVRKAFGEILLKSGDFAAAQEVLTKAVPLAPTDAHLAELLGETHLKRGNLDKAIGEYARSLRANPNSVRAHRGLAAAYSSKGDDAQAIAHAERAIAADRFDAATWYLYAKSLARLRRPEDARKASETFQTMKRYEADVERLEKIARDSPGDIQTVYDLAERHAAEGNTEAAIQTYTQIVALELTAAVALSNVGTLRAAQRKWADAEKAFRLAITRDPTEDRAHVGLIGVLVQTGRIDEASKAVEDWTRLHPNSSLAWAERGLLHYRKGDAVQAAVFLERAVQMNGDNFDAANNLAWIYAERNERLDRAYELAQGVVHKSPSATAYDTLAYIEEKRGRTAEALAAMKRAVRLDPQNDGYRKRLAELEAAKK